MMNNDKASIKITSHVEIVSQTANSVTVKSPAGAVQTFYIVDGKLSMEAQ